MSSTPETINAGTWREWFEPGDFFRLLSTTAPVSVEFYSNGKKTVELQSIEAGYAEYFRAEDGKLPFDRVRIYSATTQNVQFVTRQGSDVRYDRGASSVTGTVALDAATLAALESVSEQQRPYVGMPPVALAVGAVQILAPASNINGYRVDSLQVAGVATSNGYGTLLAKSTAPLNFVDGDGLAPVTVIASASSNYVSGRVSKITVPAGKGIWFYSAPGTVFIAGASYATLVGEPL
jgi:hypothetical protein